VKQYYLSINSTVYHVAHPRIPATVLDQVEHGGWIEVRFEKPVSFSMNPYRENEHIWKCSSNLLYPSSKEAYYNSWAVTRNHHGIIKRVLNWVYYKIRG
jgi:hypothetical protein